MKLLYSAVILTYLLPLALAKPLKGSTVFNISTAATELVQYYAEEYDLIAQEICPQIKNITDEILKDVVVQTASSNLMQTLRKNLTEYQQYYPYLKRFGVNGSLILEFSDLIKGFYHTNHHRNDKDFLYIKQLLKKFGYDGIRDKCTEKFKLFLEQKFLRKFAQLQTEIINKSKNSEEDSQILKWINDLKQCQDYECFLIDFATYKRTHGNFVNIIFGELFRELFKGFIVHAHNTTLFAQTVLKDPKLSQLSAPIQQQLIKNLQDITKLEGSFFEIQQIFIFEIVCFHLLYKFEDYASISQKDRHLVTDIFNEHDYKSLHFEDSRGELASTDYINQYERKKAKFSPKEMTQLKNLLKAVDELVNAADSQEKAQAMKSFETAFSESVHNI